MAGLPWFRLYAETIDDGKLKLLAFEDRWHFIAILCLKCSGDLEGKKQYRDRLVAMKMGLSLSELDTVKKRLMDIDLIDKDFNPTAWDARQFVSDHSNERVRKYRKSQKTGNGKETLLKRKCNAPDTDTDTEADTETEIKEKPLSSGKPDSCPHQKIIDAYHEVLPELPSVRVWNGAGKKNLQSRWREDKSRQSVDWWYGFFGEIKKSDFLMGRADKCDFRATLTWLVGPKNFEKVMNGQYKNNKQKSFGGDW